MDEAYRTIDGYDQGAKLADDILARRRRRPLVVLTASLRTGRPTVNPALISDRAGGGVDVVLLAGLAVDGFNGRAKPNGFGIWNGGVRAWRATGSTFYDKPGIDDVDSIASWAAWTAPAPKRAVDWKARARDLERRLDETKADTDDGPDYTTMFRADDPRLYDLLIRLEWARRIPSDEKDRMPLPDHWTYADGLLPLDPIVDPELLAKAMMEALTGLDANAASRDLHMLRQSKSADIRRGEWDKPIWRSRIRSGNGAPTLLYTRDDHNDVVFLHAGHHDDWLA